MFLEVVHEADQFQLGTLVRGCRLYVGTSAFAQMEFTVVEIRPSESGAVLLRARVREIEVLDHDQYLAARSKHEVLDRALGVIRSVDGYLSHILPEFKMVVTDLRDCLEEMAERVEWPGIAPLSEGTSGNTLAELNSSIFLARLEEVFGRFEAVARRVPEALESYHASYAHKRLRNILSESALLRRIINKPRGFPGDFETVKCILNVMEIRERSPFGSILTHWALRQNPAMAHKNRIELLSKHMADEIRRVERIQSQGIVDILSVGCGPAAEVFRLERRDYSKPVRIRLIDSDPGAIDDIQARYRESPLAGRGVLIECECVDVVEYKRRIARAPDSQRYDLVYCAGLLDYRTDRSGQRIIRALSSVLKPHGLLLVTNVSRSNPYSFLMNWLLDWKLRERDAGELRGLASQLECKVESIEILSEETGVNLFLAIRAQGVGSGPAARLPVPAE